MADTPQYAFSPGLAADVAVVRVELAKLITEALNLDLKPEEIDPAAPLYGEGLGTRFDRYSRDCAGRCAPVRSAAEGR